MADAEARALGAGNTIDVDGKQYKILPIGMRQLHEVQRTAVGYYKREYLRTYAENMDFLPPDRAADLIERKMEEVARWDVGDLPVKMAYDVRGVPLNAKLVDALETEYGELPEGDGAKYAVLSSALDAGKIDADQVEKLTKVRPRRLRVPYDTWWVTACYEGMITFILTSLRASHPEATAAEVGAWPLPKIMEAARIVEGLTAPAVGNTSGSPS